MNEFNSEFNSITYNGISAYFNEIQVQISGFKANKMEISYREKHLDEKKKIREKKKHSGEDSLLEKINLKTA